MRFLEFVLNQDVNNCFGLWNLASAAELGLDASDSSPLGERGRETEVLAGEGYDSLLGANRVDKPLQGNGEIG